MERTLVLACAAALLSHYLSLISAQTFSAVVNRDVDGAVVVNGNTNYATTAFACASMCANNTKCNLWVWCGSSDGCVSGEGSYNRDKGKYRQCWLKYDTPRSSGWPFWKNKPEDQLTGFISGTSEPNVTNADNSRSDIPYGDCRCKASWSALVDGVKRTFQGVCANPYTKYDAQCQVDSAGCPSGDQETGLKSCPSPQSCVAEVGVDYDGNVLVAGDRNYQSSAEECCGQCAKTKNCQLWTWCSDAGGCGVGGLQTWRQCWLKSGDPRTPRPKPAAHPGWISGVRMAYLS